MLLLGIWKNVEELEEFLSLPELEAIIDASRNKEHRHHRFLAALKGIDIDEGEKSSNEERFEEIKRRANQKLYGERSVEQQEYDIFGLEIESE